MTAADLKIGMQIAITAVKLPDRAFCKGDIIKIKDITDRLIIYSGMDYESCSLEPKQFDRSYDFELYEPPYPIDQAIAEDVINNIYGGNDL